MRTRIRKRERGSHERRKRERCYNTRPTARCHVLKDHLASRLQTHLVVALFGSLPSNPSLARMKSFTIRLQTHLIERRRVQNPPRRHPTLVRTQRSGQKRDRWFEVSKDGHMTHHSTSHFPTSPAPLSDSSLQHQPFAHSMPRSVKALRL
ncbi:hypothetical protein CPC08DRAFT_150379 [Agrocybe pediades]|nr:hypothetical protein CPC08DRAFT_150379 [Agrocybe pediades]